MIQANSIAKLAVISALIIGGAFWLNNKNTISVPQYTPKPAFPDLSANLAAVNKISVATQSGSFEIKRLGENNWVLPSKGNYPASIPVVREVLLGVAELTKVEEKTSDPNLFSRLDLQDLSNQSSEATRVTLFQDDKPVADVLLGKQRPDRANPSLNEIFIRFPNQNQSYLAKSAMNIYQTTTDWVDTRLLDIADNRIQYVEVQPANGESITLKRDKPDQKDFSVSNMPANSQSTSLFQVNRLAQALGQITLDDVMAQADFPESEAKKGFTAKLHTFDGIQIDFVNYDYENKHFVKMAALLDPNLAPTSPANNQAQQKEVAQLQQKFNNWIFVIPNWQYADIDKTQQDLLKKS